MNSKLTKKILLTLCIATINQPREIENILNVLSKTDCDWREIEIIIRDDSDNDSTKNVVSSYLNILPIKYFKNNKQGIDRAFIFLNTNAISKYVWWFGDDVLITTSLPMVLDYIRRYPDLDLIYLNSADIKNKAAYSINIKNNIRDLSREEFLSIVKDQLGFCSALVMRTSLVKDGIERAENFVGTAWVNLFLALNVLATGDKFSIMSGPLFFSTEKPPGEARWYDSYLVHAIYFYRVTNFYKDRFGSNSIKSLQKFKFSISWRAVIYERAMGFKTGFASYSPKVMPTVLTYWWHREFLLAIILLISPRFLIRYLYRLRSALLRPLNKKFKR